MDLMAELSAFLEAEQQEMPVYGRSDCTATPCRWVQRLGHRVLLPVYASKEEARAIIAGHGSLVSAWDHFLSRADVHERQGDPQLGDVAVIDTRLHGQIGGILAQGGILAIRRDEGGFAWFGPVRRFEKVWAVS
jgi:hypothetical protein